MDFRPSCPEKVDRLGFECIACLKIVLQLSRSQVKAEAFSLSKAHVFLVHLQLSNSAR
jgi:hypothetical protein